MNQIRTAGATTGGGPEVLLDLLDIGSILVARQGRRIDARVKFANKVTKMASSLLRLNVDREGHANKEGHDCQKKRRAHHLARIRK